MKIDDRVTNEDGAAATVVGRIDALFVELRYDEPQPRSNWAGVPYETRYELAHVALLTPIGAVPLW